MAGGGGPPGSAGTIELNVVPLVDVACLLIMFFILSSQFASANFASLTLASPSGSVATKDAADKYKENRVIVNVVCKVNPSDTTVMDPAMSLHAKEYSIEGNPIPLDQRDTLEAKLKTKMMDAKAKKFTEFAVEIRADKRVQYSDIEPVMIAAAKAGPPGMTVRMNITAMEAGG